MITTKEDIQRELDDIRAECYFENWDGEDAKPPTEAALLTAQRYAELEIGAGFDISLVPLCDGGMDVELYADITDKNIRVVFEIGPDGNLKRAYARIMGKKKD